MHGEDHETILSFFIPNRHRGSEDEELLVDPNEVFQPISMLAAVEYGHCESLGGNRSEMRAEL